MDIFWHELNAYKAEIQGLQEELTNSLANIGIGSFRNHTHFSLRVSNRAALIVVGLCSLVEVFLYDLAANEEKKNSFKVEDLKGNGLTRLQLYLSRTGRIDFGAISDWGTFMQIYILRNAFVHSYGGLIDTVFLKKVEKAVKQLKIESALVGSRRLRLSPKHLMTFHQTIEHLIEELRALRSDA
ncbi:hypothetical protein [Nodosilinea nodulosa]|uniref:hypothetical protein n=1 Tax=Nodosilinea nodulosa TaxID=416001 RepID=UPI000367EF27|nr:hypothetical protein [Nodosilinea nodulosa]